MSLVDKDRVIEYDLQKLPMADFEKNYTFKPILPLRRGNYLFAVNAEDRLTNSRSTIYEFEVLLALLNITLVNPSFGVSAVPVFDLIIRTTELVQGCRYATVNIPYDNIPTQSNHFTSVDGLVHVIRDFQDLADKQDMFAYEIFIKCKDSYGDTNDQTPAVYTLMLDRTPPVVTVQAEPPFVAETLYVLIIATAEEDDVRCKYDEQYDNFTLMRHKFPGFDEANFTNPVVYNKTDIQDKTNYSYFIACESKAGKISETKTVSFRVDLSAPSMIVDWWPKQYANSTSPKLKVLTNRKAICSYTLNNQSTDFTQTFTRTHETVLSGLTSNREYRIPIKCRFQIGGRDDAINMTFMLDGTPPTKPTILSGNNSCSLTSLNLVFGSDDQGGAGIKGYTYSIYRNKTPLFYKMFTDISNVKHYLEMDPDEKLEIHVIAYDIANNPSEELVQNITVTAPDSAGCDRVPPATGVLRVDYSLRTELFVWCQDGQSGCVEEFKYGFSDVNGVCTLDNTSYLANQPLIVRQNTTFCWEVYDWMYNNASGEMDIMFGADLDGDGVTRSTDCNDQNASIYPGAADPCGDHIDSNCDGQNDSCRGCYNTQDDCCGGDFDNVCDPDCTEHTDRDCRECTPYDGDCCQALIDSICDLDCLTGQDPDCNIFGGKCTPGTCDVGGNKVCNAEGTWTTHNYTMICGHIDSDAIGIDCQEGACDIYTNKVCRNNYWTVRNYCDNCSGVDSDCSGACTDGECDFSSKKYCAGSSWYGGDEAYCNKCGAMDEFCDVPCIDGVCNTKTNKVCSNGQWIDNQYCSLDVCGMTDSDCGTPECQEETCDIFENKYCAEQVWIEDGYCDVLNCGNTDIDCMGVGCSNGACENDANMYCQLGSWIAGPFCDNCEDPDCDSVGDKCTPGTCDIGGNKICNANGAWTTHNYTIICGHLDSDAKGLICQEGACDIYTNKVCEDGFWTSSGYCDNCSGIDSDCSGACDEGACDFSSQKYCSDSSWYGGTEAYCNKCGAKDEICDVLCLDGMCNTKTNKICSNGQWDSNQYCTSDVCGLADSDCGIPSCQEETCDIFANKYCEERTWIEEGYCEAGNCGSADYDCLDIECSDGACENDANMYCQVGDWVAGSFCDNCEDPDCESDGETTCSLDADECCSDLSDENCDPDCTMQTDIDCLECSNAGGDCCDPAEDEKCDPDCIIGQDPDCRGADIDCEGCKAPGDQCSSDDECTSGICDTATHMCTNPSCFDGLQNGDETEVDCGGECKPCGGERPPPPPIDPVSEGPSAIAVVFLILGLVLIIGGAGYLVYCKYYGSPFFKEGIPEMPPVQTQQQTVEGQPARPVRQAPVVGVTPSQPAEPPGDPELFKERMNIKKRKRTSLMSEFEGTESDEDSSAQAEPAQSKKKLELKNMDDDDLEPIELPKKKTTKLKNDEA